MSYISNFKQFRCSILRLQAPLIDPIDGKISSLSLVYNDTVMILKFEEVEGPQVTVNVS